MRLFIFKLIEGKKFSIDIFDLYCKAQIMHKS